MDPTIIVFGLGIGVLVGHDRNGGRLADDAAADPDLRDQHPTDWAIGTDIFYLGTIAETVGGWIPKIRISSGVISEGAPIPVMPTSTPMPSPKTMIVRVHGGASGSHRFTTFLTSLVRSARRGSYMTAISLEGRSSR